MTSRRGRTRKISLASQQHHHSLRHGDQCREDQADDNTSDINTEIKVNGQKLETVTSFMCLGSPVTDKGSNPEILSRIAQTTAALTRLKPLWNDRSISLGSKIRLMHFFVISIFSCMLVNHGSSQQNSKEEYKPWKWDATWTYYASHTKTMLPSRQLNHRTSFWPLYRDTNCSGMDIFPVH